MKKHQITCTCGCGSALRVKPTMVSGKTHSVTLGVVDRGGYVFGVLVDDPRTLDGLIEYLTAVRKGWEVS